MSRGLTFGIIVAVIIGGVVFLFSNEIIEFNQENFQQPIQNIPKDIPEIPLQVPDLPQIEDLTEIIPRIQEEIPKIQEQAKEVIYPNLNISKIELLVHEKTNIQRNIHGLSALEYDDQISDIARMHSQDMAENNYFSHTSLSGKAVWDRGFPYGYDICGTKEAILLQNEYDDLKIQYARYPSQINDQTQYQEAMSIYNRLNSLIPQINSLLDQRKLFVGLAENIYQNWIYKSTYVGGIPSDWNTEEELAEKAVEGWMNSTGHRENILSGFHSEGIGVAIAEDDKVYITQNFC